MAIPTQSSVRTLSQELLLRAFTLAFSFALAVVLSPTAEAQTFSVLHFFTGGADGSDPVAGVTVAGPGTLYGTTYAGGGEDGLGGVFKLTQRGSGWTLDPLYEFSYGNDGFQPQGPLTVAPNGALYGTTSNGGTGDRGTVLELQPPPTACHSAICYWNETVLHSFQGGANDGAYPSSTHLVLDQAGNIYGTTEFGGTGSGGECQAGCGTVFELSPSGGAWTFSILHNFQFNGIDGTMPEYGMVFDPAGNLYGTTLYGGNASGQYGGGTAFELSPSGGTWREDILYNFPSWEDGSPSQATSLIRDRSGNLYGTTDFPAQGAETIFELTPSEGSWIFSTLYTFGNCSPQPLALDTQGNLYGTCVVGGANDAGWVFRLINSGGSWTILDLHDFAGSDGYIPVGPVVLDSNGNLYGTTTLGGISGGCGGEGCGVVWEITGLGAPQKK